jgi:hypothetical protein
MPTAIGPSSSSAYFPLPIELVELVEIVDRVVVSIDTDGKIPTPAPAKRASTALFTIDTFNALDEVRMGSCEL